MSYIENLQAREAHLRLQGVTVMSSTCYLRLMSNQLDAMEIRGIPSNTDSIDSVSWFALDSWAPLASND